MQKPQIHTPLPTRRGERDFADRLLPLLDATSHVWFDLQPPGGNEIDVLLVHETIGAFVIEVKAKPLSMVETYDLETCVFTDQRGTRTPVKQAHWAMTKLRSFLEDAGIDRPPFFFATAAFPRIDRDEMLERFAPGGIAGVSMRMHLDGLAFSDDFTTVEEFEGRLHAITRRPPLQNPPRRPVPSAEQVRQLIEATTGRGAAVPGRTEPTKKPQFVTVPGRTQKDSVKRYLEPATRAPVVLRGYPGTGKTQALLDIAIAHAQAGRQVLFTCYNKVLATALRASLGVRDVPEGVRERLLVKDVFEIKSGLSGDDLGVYSATFGTVCVDEAQDMWGSLVEFVQQLATPEAEWFLADGTGQELYDNVREEHSPASHLLAAARQPGGGIQQQLNVQFRTSNAAALFAQGVFRTELDPTKIEGWVKERPLPRDEEQGFDLGLEAAGGLPTFSIVRALEESTARPQALVKAYAEEIAAELRMLEALGTPNDLMVMVPRLADEHGLVLAAIESLGVPYLDQISTDNRRQALPDGHIRLVTVHSARGVAATRVILFGSHDHRFGGSKRIPPHIVNRNAGYIALTRAKHGTRIVLVAGQQPSEFQRFIVDLARAYGHGALA